MEKIYGIYKGNHQKEKQDNLTSQSDLADNLGISKQQLQDYKKLLTLIPELQQLIESEQLSPTIGYKVLSKLSKEDQQNITFIFNHHLGLKICFLMAFIDK